ncbi:hypothetical protein LTR50_004149 [Elasticomyces elasticus]|nr:hypothetical protein LTR50_004149 [Elasticomyces elasticus]
MSSQTPPRRFAPDPMETSTKSTKHAVPDNADNPTKAARRFAPEPVELSCKASKDTERDSTGKAASVVRRLPPEPVNVSTKSSKHVTIEEPSPSTRQPRRFAPQPDEVAVKNATDTVSVQVSSNMKGRLSPQPAETSARSVRKDYNADSKAPPSPSDQPAKSQPRKFAPQLIDTAKRSRKLGDTSPCLLPAYKTDVIPDPPAAGPSRHKASPRNIHSSYNSISPTTIVPHISELRRDRSALGRSTPRSNFRSHSFHVPGLETIESSESEPSNPPSLSTSPSSSDSRITTSDLPVNEGFRHATRRRESVDEDFLRTLLDIEAKRREKQLQEEALAAFPNSDYHEPVEHYVDEGSDTDEMDVDDRPATWDGHDEDLLEDIPPRKSTTKVNWELREMQEYQSKREKDPTAIGKVSLYTDATSPWWNPVHTHHASRQAPQRDGPDPEFRRMREGAKPPMLGADLRFPRSSSPEPARFDVTQGSTTLRNQMCYLTAHIQANANSERSGLWHGPSQNGTAKSARSTGLWGGFCVDNNAGSRSAAGLAFQGTPTGLLTPQMEKEDPFENGGTTHAQGPSSQQEGLPLTPPASNASRERSEDEEIEAEFSNAFITQVYNYLSLGYPTIARPFDEELAKMSGIPVVELRQDDQKARLEPRGYIRFGDDWEQDDCATDVSRADCVRWQALKLYIREWAKQRREWDRDEGAALGQSAQFQFGIAVRRGSWGV